jgi:tRNA threonylcarbamoyl adenosine modification protein YeaZ
VQPDYELALETSSRRGSVALGHGGQTRAARVLSAERTHTAELLPAIRDLLAEVGAGPRDVGCVCFSQGPGSFTGLRVAATVARMWQSALGCRVVAVPSLEVIARNALAYAGGPPHVAVLLDARRGRVFGGVFTCAATSPNAELQMNETVAAGLHDAATWLPTLPKPCSVLGDGVAAHRATLDALGLQMLPEDYWLPDAREVLALGHQLALAGHFCTPEQIVPLYLQPPECEEVYEQRRAAARARVGRNPKSKIARGRDPRCA